MDEYGSICRVCECESPELDADGWCDDCLAQEAERDNDKFVAPKCIECGKLAKMKRAGDIIYPVNDCDCPQGSYTWGTFTIPIPCDASPIEFYVDGVRDV